MITGFMRAYPAYKHNDVLEMPWRTFLAMSFAQAEHMRRLEEARFFRNAGLAAEWEENRDEWLRLQPPPGGDINGL